MSTSTNIIKLQKELVAMPEYALISRIKTFGLSLNIFQANYKELNNAALLYCKNPKSLLLLAPKNRFKLATYQKEIIRLLHNYIASAISLIDHARILYNELYKTNNLFPDYPIEIKKRFAENPLAIFVVSLRQYILHFKNPIIRTGMHLTPNSFSAPLTLSRRNLEEFSGWKPKAKEFLNTQGDSVDLLKLIDEYYNLVMDFYKWFFRRQQEIHSEQFKKVETKQKELQQVAIPDLLETILPNTKKELVYDIITSIFELDEVECLNKMDANDPLRSEQIIKYLEKRVSLSQTIKEQFKKVFNT